MVGVVDSSLISTRGAIVTLPGHAGLRTGSAGDNLTGSVFFFEEQNFESVSVSVPVTASRQL